MNVSMIFAVGVFAFLMTLVGVALTVLEFRRTVFLKRLPAPYDHTAANVETTYIELVEDVRKCVSIPIAVKISPFFSAPVRMSRRLSDAGAKGIVLFNRFFQPDFDVEQMEVTPNLKLSSSEDLLLRLRWIAIIYGTMPADTIASHIIPIFFTWICNVNVIK